MTNLAGNAAAGSSVADEATAGRKPRNWFITGSSSGFGRLLAEHVCSLGDTVVATARNVDSLKELMLQYPAQLHLVTLDVTSQRSIDEAYAAAMARVGHIDVLVNNAGYGVTGAVEEVTAEEYGPMFETNVFGLINVTKAFLPQFREQRKGNIVNLSSIGGLIGGPGWGYYNATKFAVEGLSQALAGEMKPLGVHVTIVEPGPFRTDFLGRSGVEAKEVIADYIPTAGKAREYFQTQSGRQPGDPQKAVEAIVTAVRAAEPPLHLVLGRIAYTRWTNRLQEWKRELDEWEPVTLGSDFAEGQ
jgi:NAD(P)-dependent dehydrogenase (short-subunit alcohol dehydrogenase family)